MKNLGIRIRDKTSQIRNTATKSHSAEQEGTTTVTDSAGTAEHGGKTTESHSAEQEGTTTGTNSVSRAEQGGPIAISDAYTIRTNLSPFISPL
jgi:hypothetical protein